MLWKQSSTWKIGEQISCRYSMLMIWTSNGTENQRDVWRGEDCMKKFCETLREYVMKIINFKKKKMIPYLNQTNCRNLQQKGLEINTLLIKIVVKIGKIVIENSIGPVHNYVI